MPFLTRLRCMWAIGLGTARLIAIFAMTNVVGYAALLLLLFASVASYKEAPDA